ncbi:polysaccharide lyase family 1 protein [Flavobacterium pectinovorum]|uniref:pectate lyase family protein n=1 Tax=Flavobacterium pectinovorum TaxID=29533 RepID=UPI001FACDAEC|nr:polysaccharide lyase [Flavobacterium pectinovorum]MCI9843711.1 polysaccharide lyase [Flavobacterium pectinovorum]
MKNSALFVLPLLLLGSMKCFAQYPKISPEVQAQEKAIKEEANKLSDAAWEKALVVIEEEAKHGKPYIPWASRPNDLPQASIPAFPGAEGGGMYTFGGRGGNVYVVTSLEDRGPGTLREACEQGGARIVVFNVSGIIKIKSPLIIRAPYITIAGQTAPGDGICVAGESVWIDTHDVIIRHMRFRRGETFVGRRDDAIGGNPVGNIMIDHVSATWGLDENMSMYRHMYSPGAGYPDEKKPTVNITIQNSLFGEALDTYNHAFGSTLGGENCSFMKNMWASNAGRNPSIGWNGIFNFVNNVVYNWYNRSTDGGDYTANYNIINNFYKPGPVTDLSQPISYRILKPESGRSKLPYMVFGRAYVTGNIVNNNEKVTKDNWDGGIQIENKKGELMGYDEAKTYFDKMKSDRPFPMPWFSKIMKADEAYEYVLKNAGATLPIRDKVDERIVRTVKTGVPEYAKGLEKKTFYQFEHRRLPMDSYKQGIITDISQVGGYPEYKGKAYVDTDKDGMPDAWEKKYGLDPKDPSDAKKDLNGDGYSNIEDYINGVNPAIKVDWTDLANNKETLVRPLLDLK